MRAYVFQWSKLLNELRKLPCFSPPFLQHGVKSGISRGLVIPRIQKTPLKPKYFKLRAEFANLNDYILQQGGQI